MKRKQILGLLGICLLGFIIRIIYLGTDSYWFDEANTIGFTQWPLELFYRHYYIQRPVYFIILKVWVYLFGNSEFAARFLSVIFGSASIFLLYRFVRLFLDEGISLFASFLLSVSFFHCLWSRVVMNYSFFSFISIISSYYFIKYLKSAHRRDLILYCISTVLNIFTHPFALYLVLIQSIIVAVRERRLFNFQWWITQSFILAASTAVLGMIFFYPSLNDTCTKRIHEVNYIDPVVLKTHPFKINFQSLEKVYQAFTFGGKKIGHGGNGFPVLRQILPWGYMLLAVYTIFFLLGLRIILDYLKNRKKINLQGQEDRFKKTSLLYIIYAVFIPIIITFIVQLYIYPVLCERYFFFSYHFFLIILSIGFYEGIKTKWVRRAILIIVSVAAIIFSINLYIPVRYKTWRDIAIKVRENIKAQDAIVLIPFGQITSFWFYFSHNENKYCLYDKTMDGVYKDEGWRNFFEYNTHFVTGNYFGKIDSFIQEEPFKKMYLEKRDIWLVMSPHWEKVDMAAEKIYKEIEKNYKKDFGQYYHFNGVSLEKWVIKQ